MTVDEIKNGCKEFFKMLKDAGVLKNRTKEPLERVTRMGINLKNQGLAFEGFNKIHELQMKSHPIPENEYRSFFRRYHLLELAVDSENLKHNFKLILDPSKISFDDDTMYGTLMARIFDKLKLQKDKIEKYKDMFFVDFRNAFFHEDYLIRDDLFSYKITNQEKVIHWDNNRLAERRKEFDEIINQFNEFIEYEVSKL